MLGFDIFQFPPRSFNRQFVCFSIAMIFGNDRDDVEKGGNIIMPRSALRQLTRFNIDYPLLFQIYNIKRDQISHCGVVEFVADEGKVYVPCWMMRNLMLEEGDKVQIESVTLPIATSSKFQPQSPAFLDISNPKAVLEKCLRNYSCLTTGDLIRINYNQKEYELSIVETQPGNAVNIIECDMNIEFSAPVDYQESNLKKESTEKDVKEVKFLNETNEFVPFLGEGHRLNGKEHSDGKGWKTRTFSFMRPIEQAVTEVVKQEEPFQTFSGEAHSLSTSEKQK